MNVSLEKKSRSPARLFPVGAEVQKPEGVHFRVWAPTRKKVEVVLEETAQEQESAGTVFDMIPEDGGYFSCRIQEAGPGVEYRFRLDNDPRLYPDPASRYQPQGPHGPSQVIDPGEFKWTDSAWKGVKAEGQVLYEMHVGTFTHEGNWEAAERQIQALAETGITVVELLPVADFPGRFGWGYDGVNLFAPTRLYGTPDDFRRFVDRAHKNGIGVILDVVYNHLGPDGNYLSEFSKDYFTDRYECEWGQAINFDGRESEHVREYFLANAAYWIREFHLDGIRLDATQQIFDSSENHMIADLTRTVREAARSRSILIVAENEPQRVIMVLPADEGGYGVDALWNDDFHHSAMVAMTGRADAYYSDYRGRPQEFISALRWGYLYQGQWYRWQKKRRGTPCLDLSPTRFVNYLQNHDQLANSGSGKRIHLLTSPGRYRALTTILLLAPQTPMLFQGQEFASSSPFFYFADHNAEIAHLIASGRAQFLAQFRALATPEMQARLPDPGDPMTFAKSKLDHEERRAHPEEYALHRDLLRMRREDAVFSAPRHKGLDGAVLGQEAFVLRFFGEKEGNDRLVLVNLGRDLELDPSPEPLLAPVAGTTWNLFWASEDPRYGGMGVPPLPENGNWHIQGEAAVILKPGLERQTSPEP
ncbi:MAG: malto-oligosyltrehalose trehalohydrolase [Deltaproteobacteria bacterium HGW-Deltaproteobacteria-21]|nr:MAG: malto-oligosyltrehalose trehalohydrolase [Deltaproteobacteria bacterium HGW-Deltaproteobacteria-21]